MRDNKYIIKKEKILFLALIVNISMWFFMSGAWITLKALYGCITIGLLCVCSDHIIYRGVPASLIVMCFLYVLYIFLCVFNSDVYIATTKGRAIGTVCVNIVLGIISTICYRIEKRTMEKGIYFLTFIAIFFSIKSYSISELYYGLLGVQRLGDKLCGINSYGMYLALISLFCFYKFFDADNKKVKSINGILFVLLFCLSITSGSRKALSGEIIGILLILLMLTKRNKIIMVLKVALVAFVLLYIISSTGITTGALGRLMGADVAASYSDQLRSDMIKNALQGWKQHPLFGNGFNTFTVKTLFDTYAHNNYVELLFDIGIFGTVLFYLPKAYLLYAGLKYCKIDGNDTFLRFLIIIMIELLLLDFACVSYYSVLLNFWWWIIGIYLAGKQIDVSVNSPSV